MNARHVIILMAFALILGVAGLSMVSHDEEAFCSNCTCDDCNILLITIDTVRSLGYYV
jgi:hypothetical protein